MPADRTSISRALGLGQPPLATVLLAHELPDGTHHIDWMAARDSKNRQPLVSFWLDGRLDELAPDQTMSATRIQDHRPRYLDYEGEIAGQRGRVRRVQSGTISRWSDLPDLTLVLDLVWGSGGGERGIVQQVEVRAEKSSQWLVKCVSMRRC